jgi:hypothetical protein
MPAYNFKSRFAEAVKTGAKRTTIRKPRKRPTVARDILILYTGLRTKKCRLIGVFLCESVQLVTLYPFDNDMDIDGMPGCRIAIEGIASSDGFESADAFFEFFRSTYGEKRLAMELITWNYPGITIPQVYTPRPRMAEAQ